jgi:hypothetical protein
MSDESKGIDWARIRTAGFLAKQYAIEELQSAIADTGTFDIEEVMLRQHQGGGVILAAMAEMIGNPSLMGGRAPTFRFKALRLDATGTPAKPGATFRVCVGQKTSFWGPDGQRRAMNTEVLNAMAKAHRNRGKKDDDPNLWEEYKLDDECCFSTHWTTAMYLLLHCSSVGSYQEKIEVKRIDPQTHQETGEPWQTSYNWIVEYVRPSDALALVGTAAPVRRVR